MPHTDDSPTTRDLSDAGRWDADLVAALRASGTLCLSLEDPGWENARGYLFSEPTMTLYFPVAKQYLTGSLSQYEVLIMGDPKVVVRGELQSATSEEDVEVQMALAHATGMDADEARYMLLDQRTRKARRTRYKLLIEDLARSQPVTG